MNQNKYRHAARKQTTHNADDNHQPKNKCLGFPTSFAPPSSRSSVLQCLDRKPIKKQSTSYEERVSEKCFQKYLHIRIGLTIQSRATPTGEWSSKLDNRCIIQTVHKLKGQSALAPARG